MEHRGEWEQALLSLLHNELVSKIHFMNVHDSLWIQFYDRTCSECKNRVARAAWGSTISSLFPATSASVMLEEIQGLLVHVPVL